MNATRAEKERHWLRAFLDAMNEVPSPNMMPTVPSVPVRITSLR
jgi:hypothetical protein